MTPIYENYRSETPVYFHYATGSKNYEISLFGLKHLATTVSSNQSYQQSIRVYIHNVVILNCDIQQSNINRIVYRMSEMHSSLL